MEDYFVESFIGNGRFSLVYLVSRRNSVKRGKEYVLKRCFLEGPEFIKCVLNERQMLEKVSNKSPFLPVLEAAFWMGSSAAIVMTACSEMNLHDVIYTLTDKTEETAKFYAAEILCGLEYLHSLKIVHMDIKPSNILISRSGHVLITDFKNSLDISGGPTPHPLKFGGSAIYCSPEVATYSIIDEKADIWSWASVLVELVDECVGNTAFHSEVLLDLAKKGEISMKHYNSYSFALKNLLNLCFKLDNGSRTSIEIIKRCVFFRDINWTDAANCRLTPQSKFKIYTKIDQPATLIITIPNF